MNELIGIDDQKRRQRIETVVKVVGLAVVGFIVAPFIFVAIKGLIGLAIAGTIGLAGIYATPWIAAKFANWRLKLIKAEAMKNPIETLQNDYSRRQEALGQFLESIKKFAAEVMTFKDKLVTFSKQYPDEADKFKDNLLKMNQLLQLRQAKYKDAKENLADYELEIQKASAIWDMGQAAAQMNKAAGMSQDDFFAKIAVETALDSVQKNLNTAFAELETSLLDEDKDVKAMRESKANLLVADQSTPDSSGRTRTKIAV